MRIRVQTITFAAMRLLNKYFLSLIAVCALSAAAIAQTGKKQYTMAEAVNGLSGSLAPKGVKGAQWRQGTHELYYKSGDTTIVYNATTNKLDKLSKDDFFSKNNNESFLDRNSWYYQKDDTLNISSYKEKEDKSVILKIEHHDLPKKAANFHFASGDLHRAAFTVDNNLYYTKDAANIAITSDTNPNIINGQAVHRNEFGIDNGIFFSPKGNLLAYYRMDQTMVKDYPVIDWSEIPAKATNVKYPMAGDSSHQVTLRVYNIATQQTITLKTGEHEKDHYLTCFTWSPDEQYIYVGILNRGQNHLWLNQYSAKTGEKIKTLFEETSDKYVEPQHPLSFIPGSNTQFIWWSQRDGYMHLWLCDMEKNSIKCLTPGDYVVNELIGFNKRTGEVLYTSAEYDPREKHGFAVNWKTGNKRSLESLNEHGTHTYTASDDGEYLFDVFSNDPLVLW